MGTPILLKRSSVASKVPQASDLEYGELAINYTDGKLYYKDASNTVRVIADDDGIITNTISQGNSSVLVTDSGTGDVSIIVDGTTVLSASSTIVNITGDLQVNNQSVATRNFSIAISIALG